MPTRAPRIYVASPLGFTAAGRAHNALTLLPSLREAGFEVLDPWEVEPEIEAIFALGRDEPERTRLLAETNRRVGQRNAELIRSADGLLAILDGADVDSGTAAEIGYAAALPRPVVGLRTDFRTSGDNEQTLVNLQVEWFVVESGGALATSLAEAIARLDSIFEGNN